MLKDLKIVDYVNEVDSEKPLPGGGSVAALVGALGVALSRMLSHLSINKKLFNNASFEKQQIFIAVTKDIAVYRQNLLDGIDSDALSYKCVLDAYKSKNEESIQIALKASAFVAYDILINAYETLDKIENLVELGNKNVLSDLVAGAILLQACMEISYLNVKANANLLSNEVDKNFFLNEGLKLCEKGKKLKENIISKVDQRYE